MSNDKKFNIRIKFNPKDVKTVPIPAPSEPAYIYHWPRIIGAIVITLGIVGGSFYYLNNQTDVSTNVTTVPALNDAQQEKILPQTEALLTSTSKVIDNKAPLQDEITIDSNNDSAPLITATELPLKEPNTIDIKPIIETSSLSYSDNQSTSSAITTLPPLADSELTTTLNDLTESENKTIPQVDTDTIAKVLAEQTATKLNNQQTTLTDPVKTNIVTTIFKQTHVEIFSPQITRFVIAENVNDKEPIGSVEDIQFDENNIATVYAYSDAIGFADKFLYYEWYLNGQQVARVEVGAWGDRWRSFTHKFIQPNKQGDWSVILKNEVGDKLAIAEFTY